MYLIIYVKCIDKWMNEWVEKNRGLESLINLFKFVW